MHSAETINPMLTLPYALARPFLFGLDPEHAHELTLGSIATLQNTPAMCLWQAPRVSDPVTLADVNITTELLINQIDCIYDTIDVVY